MADMEDEFVCTSCGMVAPKEVIEQRDEGKVPQALDYTSHALGSYMGPMEQGQSHWSGFSKSASSFKYLKLISDHACRDEGAVYSCARTIERVSEKLLIPKSVIGQSMSIAKKMVEMKRYRGEFTAPAISAFSIMTACKLYGITSVGVREVIGAHEALGHRVKTSTIIQMAMESPVRPMARRAEDYLSRVASHLSSNERLCANLRNDGRSEVAYTQGLLETARRLLEKVDGASRGGHSPCGMAATSIYAAEIIWSKAESRKKFFTQRDVAECAGVAEYTVREQYGEIFRIRAREMADGSAVMEALPRQGCSTRTVQTPPLLAAIE